MSQLLIYLHNDQQIDYRLDDNGQIQHETTISLDKLPASALNTYCIVLVPGEQVAINRLVVPDTSYSRLIKIVPYAMEDQLIDDPEDLHFAFDQVNSNGSLPTAIVKNEVIEQWLTTLRSAGIQPKIMIPDYLALPYEENIWHIYLTHGHALIRIRSNYGMSIELSQLALFLELKLQESLTKPHALKIAHSKEHQDFDKALLHNIQVPIDFSDKSIEPMDMFATGLKRSTVINLIQGDFSHFKAKGKTKKLWRVVQILIAACCIVWLATSVIEYTLLKRQLSHVQNSVQQLYFQAFPDASAVVEPVARVQRLYDNLKDSGSGGVFLSLVALAGQQIQTQGNNITIREMRFSDNTLSLEVASSDFKNFEIFSQQLLAKRVNVQQSNARTTDDGVTARLTLTGEHS